MAKEAAREAATSTRDLERSALPNCRRSSFYFNDTKLTKITTALVEAYKQARVQQVDKVYRNSELNVLSAVLAYARHRSIPCVSPEGAHDQASSRSRRRRGSRRRTRAGVHAILAGAAEIGPAFPRAREVHRRDRVPALRGDQLQAVVARRPRRGDGPDLERGRRRGEGEDGASDDRYEVKSRERESLCPMVFQWPLPEEQRERVDGSALGVPRNDEPRLPWRPRAHKEGGALRGLAEAHMGGSARGKPANALGWGGVDPDPRVAHTVCVHTFASLFLAMMPDLFALGRVLDHSHIAPVPSCTRTLFLPDHLATT